MSFAPNRMKLGQNVRMMDSFQGVKSAARYLSDFLLSDSLFGVLRAFRGLQFQAWINRAGQVTSNQVVDGSGGNSAYVRNLVVRFYANGSNFT